MISKNGKMLGMSKRFALEETGLTRMSHISLQVSDMPRALAFYQDILGLQIVLERDLEGPEFEAVTATPGARSKLIRGLIAGNSVVQLFWHNWREPQLEKRTLMSFEVRDAYAAHRRLVEAEVPCQSEPVAFDNSHAFVISDPDGHPIEIIQWTPDAAPYRVPSP
jgi:catechol 2,3-dioxygenase-like lactoylglutathione lyase family enzyme